MEKRLYVSDFLLSFYDRCLQIIADKNRLPNGCPLLRSISTDLVGRPLKKFTPEHMQVLELWKTVRFEGEFWYLGYTSEGGLFAHLGDRTEEEKIFVVKAVSSSFTELFSGRFADPDIVLPGTVVETVLLPYNGGITYFCTLASSSLVPKKHDELFARLEGIVERCTARGAVYRTLDASLTKLFVRHSSALGIVSSPDCIAVGSLSFSCPYDYPPVNSIHPFIH
jgi:hypothetical protein